MGYFPLYGVRTILLFLIPLQILFHELIGHGIFARWTKGSIVSRLRNAVFFIGPEPQFFGRLSFAVAPLISIAVGIITGNLLDSHYPTFYANPGFWIALAGLFDLLPIPGFDGWNLLRGTRQETARPSIMRTPIRMALGLTALLMIIIPGLLNLTNPNSLEFLYHASAPVFGGLVFFMLPTIYKLAREGKLQTYWKTLSTYAPLNILSLWIGRTAFISAIERGRVFLDSDIPNGPRLEYLNLRQGSDSLLTWYSVALGSAILLVYAHWRQRNGPFIDRNEDATDRAA